MSKVLKRLGSVAEGHWGLVTTAETAGVGVDRHQMSRLASTGVLTPVMRGVYRMPGAPEQQHEMTYATWLALGGAGPRDENGVPPVVAAGATSADLLDIGVLYPNGYHFLVPRRRVSRLPSVRLRTRQVQREGMYLWHGIPTLRAEDTVADLVCLRTDPSLVADVLCDAVRQCLVVSRPRLESLLDPFATRFSLRGRTDGAGLLAELLDIAGMTVADIA